MYCCRCFYNHRHFIRCSLSLCFSFMIVIDHRNCPLLMLAVLSGEVSGDFVHGICIVNDRYI